MLAKMQDSQQQNYKRTKSEHQYEDSGNTETIRPELTRIAMDLNLRVMGDKSPKAAQKHAAQKQVKAAIAKQKKDNAATAKQVAKIKK
jgi:hypothetical protein